MYTTFYRVKGEGRSLGDAGTTKEIQALLSNAGTGEYAIDVVSRDSPQDEGTARHWGKAIKHADGSIHLESDQPGE